MSGVQSIFCTWKDCLGDGEYPQKSGDGEIWAVLCVRHNLEYATIVAKGDPDESITAWVAAQGGEMATRNKQTEE